MTIQQKISALRAKIAQTPDGALLIPSADVLALLNEIDRVNTKFIEKIFIGRALFPAMDKLQDKLNDGAILQYNAGMSGTYDIVDPVTGEINFWGETMLDLMVKLVMVDG